MSSKTDFEKIWEELPQERTIEPHRIYRRDVRNFFDFSQTEYLEKQLSPLKKTTPDSNWVKQKFHSAVLGTPEGRTDLQLVSPKDISFQTTTITSPNWETVLRYMEDHILHVDLIHGLSEPKGDIVDKIIWVLCHKKIGEKNKQHMSGEAIKKILDACVAKNQPVRILLPAFPFKDQNPFRTEASPSHVDMGEVVMLARLYILVRCLMEVLPSIGVELIVATDGVIYSSIFGIKKEEAVAYRERMRAYRNLLNLQHLIHIVDINDIIGRIDGFDTVQKIVTEHLQAAIRNDQETKTRFDVLVRGIKFNLNLRTYMDQYDLEALTRTLDDAIDDDSLADKERNLRTEIDQQAQIAALKYVSLHLTMGHFDMFERFFPFSLRATIHPKVGQIGIAKDGKMLPWNGVPLVSEIAEEQLWKNVQVLEVSRIFRLAHNRILRKAYLEGDSSPFYYQVIDDQSKSKA